MDTETTPNVVHVVDDDDSARESLKMLLDAHGLRVWTYPAGQDFLDRIADHEDTCQAVSQTSGPSGILPCCA